MTYVIEFDDRPEPVVAPDANPQYGFPAVTTQGRPGLSTYELAVLNGYEGTLEEWLEAQAGGGVDLTALTGRVSALETDVETLEGDVDDLESGAEFYLEVNFASATNQWVIVHNQGTYGLSVETFLPNDAPIEGTVSYPDLDTITVDWYYPTSGYARVFS